MATRHLTSILLIASIVACAPGPRDGPTGHPRLRVAVQASLGPAPIFIAAAEGYFEDAGLDVELIEMRAVEGRLTAVLTGNVDVTSGLVALADLAAMQAGAPIRMVADRGTLAAGRPCPYLGFVLRPGLDTATAGPLIRRASVAREGPGLYLLERLIESRGGVWDSVEMVPLLPSARPEAIGKGMVDLIELPEPQLPEAMRRGTFWLDGADVVPGMQWGTIIFGKRLLGVDRELGMRFMTAYRRGILRYNEGKTPRNVAIVSSSTGLDSLGVANACWPAVREDARLNLASIMSYQAWAVRRGFLLELARPDQLWDSSFVVATDRIVAPSRSSSPAPTTSDSQEPCTSRGTPGASPPSRSSCQ
jgi:NitT/TauT family transport system substrate-binding protein